MGGDSAGSGVLSGGRRDRGVSEVIGIVMLFALVISGGALILMSGSELQGNLQEQNYMEVASDSMKKIDEELRTLSYRSEASVSGVEFPQSGGRVSLKKDSAQVRLNIIGHNNADCQATLSLGSIKYVKTEDSQSIVYEGGGIWKVTDGTPQLVSPPSLRYKNGTVHLTAVDLEGSMSTTTSGLSARKKTSVSEETTRQAERNLVTPVDQCSPRQELWITLTSDYERAWGKYLKEEFPSGTVTNDHTNGDGKLVVHLQGDDVDPFDSDDDSIADADDNCQFSYNPGQLDHDDNGNGDVCDNDDDGDGINDYRNTNDPRTSGNLGFVSKDYYQDRNDDGYIDFPSGGGDKYTKDNCPKVSNPQQNDYDGDGVGYKCDDDPDGDSRVAHQDNCIKHYNPNQTDNDTDGRGDHCDPDDDDDGFEDPWAVDNLENADNCVWNQNPDQKNFDGSIENWPDGRGIRGDICDINDDNDQYNDTDEWGWDNPNPDQCVRDVNNDPDSLEDDPNYHYERVWTGSGFDRVRRPGEPGDGDMNEIPEKCEDTADRTPQVDEDQPIERRNYLCDRDDSETWWHYDQSGGLPAKPYETADDDGNAEFDGRSNGVRPIGCYPSTPKSYLKSPPDPKTEVVSLTVNVVEVDEK